MTKNYPHRVLVVDDEPLIRWSIAETVNAHGHTVLEAESGAPALRALQVSSRPVDAVVLDYRLPIRTTSRCLHGSATLRRGSP